MKRYLVGALLFLLVVFFILPQATLAQKRGGELTIAIGTDPENIDPVQATSAPAIMVMEHIMEPLFRYTEEGEILPLLAKDYDVSEDGLTWDLYLEEGILFHDGTPFNAQAVQFSLERMRDGVYAFLIDSITDVQVIDEYTVRITTGEPFAPLLAHLAHHFISIVSPTAVEKYGEDFNENPVGTGPFAFESWSRGEILTIVRNEAYWGDHAYLDRVIFRIVPEDSTRVVLLETGEAHAIMRVPPRDVERLQERDGLEILSIPSVRTIYIGFHCQKEPFTDRRVRQAINYAVDNEAIVTHILGGAGRASDAPISPGIFGYFPQEPYAHNPERARELLAEAGFPDGLEVTLHHPVGRYLMDDTIAQAVQSQLAEVGIDVQLITLEWATLLETLGQRYDEAEQELYLMGWGCVTGDADYGLFGNFHSEHWRPGGPGRSYYANEEADVYLEKARITPDDETRLEAYERATQIIWEDAPWLFMHSESQINGVWSNVKGLVHHPNEFISAVGAWIEE